MWVKLENGIVNLQLVSFVGVGNGHDAKTFQVNVILPMDGNNASVISRGDKKLCDQAMSDIEYGIKCDARFLDLTTRELIDNNGHDRTMHT